MEKNEIAFLKGLSALTRRTGIQIAACGCCSSPFLMKVENRKGSYKTEHGDDVRWEAEDTSEST